MKETDNNLGNTQQINIKRTNNPDEVSIFSDLDLVKLQDERGRELLLMRKLNALRKKYFAKVKLVHALEDQLLLTKEFRDINKYKYLKLLSNQVNELDEDFKDDDSLYSKEEKIINELNDENVKLNVKRQERIFPLITNLGENRKENKIFFQRPQTKSTCKLGLTNLFIKFLLLFAPFKKDIRYLSYNFNTTIVLYFDIIRFLFMMSVFSVVIFLYLLIVHLIKFKNFNPDLKLNSKCKYGIPCCLLYGSFNDPNKEFSNYSITYGVWSIFLFLGMIIFYYRNDSNRKKQNVFKKLTKFSELSTYFFNSWDMKTCTYPKSRSNKKQIMSTLKKYYDIFTIKKKRDRLNLITSNILLFILFHLLFIVYLAVIIIVEVFSFKLREFIRDGSDRYGLLKGRNALADLMPLILTGFWLNIFPSIINFFIRFEKLTQPIYKTVSRFIKKIIINLVIIGSAAFIQIEFILFEKKENKLFKGISSYQCHGRVENGIFPTLANLPFIDTLTTFHYSRCKEDEVGTNFLFIAVSYIIFYYIIELFLFIIYKLSKRPKRKIKYRPFDTLLHIFTEFILISICVYFIPYTIILLIFVMLIEFKYQYYKIRYRCNHRFDNLSVQRRSNTYPLIVGYMWLCFINMCFILYFYVETFPRNKAFTCKSNTAFILKEESQIYGPIQINTNMAFGMTQKISNTVFIKWLYESLTEVAIFLIILCVIIGATFFKNYSPSKEYYDYLVVKQKRLVEYLTLLNEHLVRRDIVTSILLRAQNKKKNQ